MTTPAQRALAKCDASNSTQRMIYAIESCHYFTWDTFDDDMLRVLAHTAQRQGWMTAYRAAIDEIDRRFV